MADDDKPVTRREVLELGIDIADDMLSLAAAAGAGAMLGEEFANEQERLRREESSKQPETPETEGMPNFFNQVPKPTIDI